MSELASTLDPTVVVAVLPVETTVAIAAVIVAALAAFIAFMTYLAFGPHNRQLQDDASPVGEARSATDDPDAEAVEERKDASGSDPETDPVAGAGAEPGTEPGTETDGVSSAPGGGSSSGSPEGG